MELSLAEVQEILRVFAESELEELRLEFGGTRLYVSKRGAAGADRFDAPGPVGAASPELGQRAAVGGLPPAAQAAAPTAAAAQMPAPPPADRADAGPTAATTEGLHELRSPLLGVFYRRPSPDKPPFVEIGSVVAADDPVCIVDVMKMFTRIPAGSSGRIVEICAEDGQLIEHGQVLARIDPR